MCTIVYVDQTESTNSLLASSAKQFDHGTAIAAHAQSRGRGQRGNTWESEPGKNLTFSILLKPKAIVAARQFELSQVVSIAIAKTLRHLLDTQDIYIKWPNDIYYRDKKICGILIENTLSGNTIDQSIVGIGINVNQEEFVSDAPNPVSMKNITSKGYDLDQLIELFVTQIVDDYDEYERNMEPTQLVARYRRMLWRNEGFWPYHDNRTDQDITARIAAVDPSGHITMLTSSGDFRTYAFKEISAII